MRIGIISDIHDNVWALEKALEGVRGCDALLCLGDLCAPFTIAQIAKGFEGPVHLVWGNNDGDKLHIAASAEAQGDVHIHGDFADLTLDGRHIAMTHYPHLAQALGLGQQYDLVCYGHNHERAIRWEGRTLLVNPGEVMGRFGVSSWAVYDTESGRAEIIERES
jgi:putative phosphoesterase